MNHLVIGVVSGIIFGLISKFAFSWGWDIVIVAAIMGAMIALAQGRIGKAGYWLTSLIVGAAFYALMAMMGGFRILDHSITGAVTGLLIGAIMFFVGPKLAKGSEMISKK